MREQGGGACLGRQGSLSGTAREQRRLLLLLCRARGHRSSTAPTVGLSHQYLVTLGMDSPAAGGGGCTTNWSNRIITVSESPWHFTGVTTRNAKHLEFLPLCLTTGGSCFSKYVRNKQPGVSLRTPQGGRAGKKNLELEVHCGAPPLWRWVVQVGGGPAGCQLDPAGVPKTGKKGPIGVFHPKFGR